MNASGYGEALYFDANNFLNYIWTDGANTSHYRTNVAITDTDWHMLSVELGAPRYVRMYLDNSSTNIATQISQADFTNINNVANDEPLLIGMGPDGDDGFEGYINRMWLLKSLFGSDDHCEIWADGRPCCVRACADAANIVYQWRFGNQDNWGVQRGLLWDLHSEHMHGTLVGLTADDLVDNAPGAP